MHEVAASLTERVQGHRIAGDAAAHRRSQIGLAFDRGGAGAIRQIGERSKRTESPGGGPRSLDHRLHPFGSGQDAHATVTWLFFVRRTINERSAKIISKGELASIAAMTCLPL